MKIAIIGAMDKEVELVSNALQNKKVVYDNNYKFEIGNICNHEIILTVSSIGKVASGMLMGILFMKFPDIDKVINIGVAGGVMGKVNPGDVVISEKLSYFDADARGFSYRYGQIPGFPLYFYGDEQMLDKVSLIAHKGTILTADIFQTDKNNVQNVIDLFFAEENVLCLDMESTAFAQCAYRQNVGFIAIRAISDVVGSSEQTIKYENTLEFACAKAHEIMMEIIEKL